MPYAPFFEKFLEIAQNETRSFFIKNNPNVPDDEYSLMELFCDEKNCDCQRVMFNVMSEKQQNIIATIAYGWESRKFYEKWFGGNDSMAINEMMGIKLNTASHQCEFAPELLHIIENILKDPAYVERIKRHYKLFRDKVDKDNKIEPIKANYLVDRNAPCPCGSGKKYKKCCVT